MRILVHDYCGHPFQVQLSRSLAKRGHTVRHVYCRSFQSPRGALARRADDPASFEVEGIDIGEAISKYSFVRRRGQETRYGRLLARDVHRFAPDAVISANTPLDAQVILQRACRASTSRFVLWLQDIYSVAIEKVLKSRHPVLGRLVAWYYKRIEDSVLRRSDRIIVITEDFLEYFDWRHIRREDVYVIPNWAPLEELPVRPKDNVWARAHGLADKFCFLYSGTLGLKHNPSLLLHLALNFRDRSEVRVVVISEGLGAGWLRDKRDELGLENLILLDFQPFEEMPEVQASADVLIAILEADAGIFSVPSKVLTYLCAQRPLLLAVPSDNLVARIVSRSNAGIVVSSLEPEAFARWANYLADDPAVGVELARNGRAYAERAFDVARITTAFEGILGN